ncbi:hypothetical protein ACIHIX_06180 [Streptomyces sp. NPDC051913]|uniref:hypothetical protein n=1 Tax=Streptomyces sp. NPDC051913 TaxID=3365676 RepID=UPI0037D561C7
MTPLAPGRRTQSAVSAAPEPPAQGPPAQWHRVLTLLADVSLFIGTRAVWTQAASHRVAVAAVISVCYASILGCGVLALTVRRHRSLARLDLLILLTAVTLTVCAWALLHQGGDEAQLTTQAAKELAAGHPMYGRPWPWLFGRTVALTPTVTGTYDLTYGYPPLAPLLTVPFLGLGHGAAPATAVSTAALIVGAVLLWRMLPAPWRPTATMVFLGFGMLPQYARLGYPAIVGLALLVPVVVGWPRIGKGGRLGASGLARAACLGAACAAQQLPWFLAPFLLAGLYAVRRGELGARPAALLLLRFTGTAATVWLLLNTYFVVSEPKAWLEGIALPLTQGAVLHGQGLVDVSLYLTDGSDRLDWYSHASLLLAAGLFLVFVLFVRRLGPAATVLPWCAFFLATRSQDGYYLMMTPLWLAAAVTAPASEFAGAWQPRLGTRRIRVAAAALALTPALLAATLAATGEPPLHLTITALHRSHPVKASRLALTVTNTSGTPLTPHFMLTAGQGMSRYWRIVRGPKSLPAHTTASYELGPPAESYGGRYVIPRAGAQLRLRVFTAVPQTLSTTYVRLPSG